MPIPSIPLTDTADNKILNRDFSQTKQPIAWTIAGSDNSAGAGLQADLKSFASFGVYGCSIVTAITAQNSTKVSDIQPVTNETLINQWETLNTEYPPAAIKLGVLANQQILLQVKHQIKQFLTDKTNKSTHIICDPVLFATNGDSLMQVAESYLDLIEVVDLLTPNEDEFYQLFGGKNLAPNDLAQKALEVAKKYQIDLVITGGESQLNQQQASDCCVINNQLFWLDSPTQKTNHTHGTGCSFSSAIAASLALGYSKFEAVVLAKTYINQGLIQPKIFNHTAGFIHTRFPNLIDCLPIVSASYQFSPVKFPPLPNRELGIYPIVDNLQLLAECLQNNIKIIQLRVKDQSESEIDLLIKQAVELANQHQAWLFINDYWQLAIKHQAFGVHLGQEDLQTANLAAISAANLRLGISTHSWFEIAKAHSIKPSYIAIGPIFATTTKQMPFAPQGLQQLQQWQKLLTANYPLVAIGGINQQNARQVLATGVDAIAMVRPIMQNTDKNLRRLNKIYQQTTPSLLNQVNKINKIRW